MLACCPRAQYIHRVQLDSQVKLTTALYATPDVLLFSYLPTAMYGEPLHCTEGCLLQHTERRPLHHHLATCLLQCTGSCLIGPDLYPREAELVVLAGLLVLQARYPAVSISQCERSC